MDTNKLILFHCVARHQSFTKAAEECHVAQAAMSRSIASLEDELGFKLFDRSSRKVSLTAAGKSFLDDTISITNELYTSIIKAQGIDEQFTEYLAIGYGSYEIPIIQHHVSEYLKENPYTDIELFQYPSQELSSQLISRSCDIVYGPNNRLLDINNAKYVHIGSSEIGFLVGTEGNFKNRDSVTPKQLSGLPLYLPVHKTASLTGDFIKQCEAMGFTPSKVTPTNTPEAMYTAVSMGMGYSMVPLCMNPYLRADLKIIPIQTEKKMYKTQVAACLRNTYNQTAQKYIDFVERKMNERAIPIENLEFPE